MIFDNRFVPTYVITSKVVALINFFKEKENEVKVRVSKLIPQDGHGCRFFFMELMRRTYVVWEAKLLYHRGVLLFLWLIVVGVQLTGWKVYF